MKDIKKEHNSEILKLNDKINDLLFYEDKYMNLKGRFIYKSFIDYLFLILGINVDMKLEDKKIIRLLFERKQYKFNKNKIQY